MTGTRSRRPKGNLPAETTSFVGRRGEVGKARRLLSTARLVTLTGAAGVGKTRLALRVAAQLHDGFPDGVWLVELAALADDKLLPQTIADVLGIQDGSARPLLDTVSGYLEDKRLLLVLDNCEHLVDACAILADRLLRTAPDLRILASSRHALRAAGEHLLEVAPLPVPDLNQAQRRPTRYAAVRLFGERAAAALPGFRVGAGSRDTVARICHRLDGIPLAIELAAVRVRAMPVHQILRRLDDYFEFLAEGSRASIPRLRTLRATIDWSFDLCSVEEQDMWARASEFIGGFDLNAAETVCAGEDIAREAVLDLVDNLVSKSILTRVDGTAMARYRMLEPIRQYGQERLASSGHRTTVRTRHRDHYGRLAKQAERAWLGAQELEHYAQLQCEHANLRAGLEFCLTESTEEKAGLDIGSALWIYWFLSCSHTEGRYWLDRALEANPQPSPARAKALWINAWLALMQADTAAALSMVGESRRSAQRLDAESALGHALRVAGLATFFQDDVPGGAMLLDEALDCFRAAGDRSGVWITLLQLAGMTAILGEPQRAVDLGEECVDLSHTRAHLSRSWALWGLAISRWLIGDREGAGGLVREVIRINHRPSNRWSLVHSIEILGWITAAEGQYRRAARLLGAADPIWRSTGVLPGTLRHLAPSHHQCEQQTRQSLGDETFTLAFREGTRLTIDEAIAYALEPQRS
ncbi:non-specific serine/threonine protein kinase [Kibdelosporangium banguiense]|uniref:Non-specific serine/threonine protein kinase n=1 Tax=Kibdelosporangium banguiense TaxID=1365924 RepID=A0ABS4TGN0_9PSEU|nr:AAA family ATPase [Kibdelosporangium banguiense]MBP2323539.1 non-specific serine/threonine protein kinase [Kibdelosporangium banguiense]